MTVDTFHTVVIDDLRNFIDRRPAAILRTSADALTWFAKNEGARIDELWLDHDLGEPDGLPDTIMRVVDYLSERGYNDNPVDIGVVYVHTSNPVGRKQIIASLERYGYFVKPVQAQVYFTV